MYINISKDIIIKLDDIIGIFDMEENNKKDALNSIIERLIENKAFKDISDGNPKSIVLYKKEGKERGILSNISSYSLKKKKKIIN